MTMGPNAPCTKCAPAFPMTADDLRRHARASGQEVWEQVGDRHLYTCFDRPGVPLTREGVPLTREDVRARRNTLMLHTSSDALAAPF